ncbi:MAG: phage major capsid protein [Ruminococcus sp.]|nr:phage major capsid protein [Ruminococcus sp.]
MGRKKILEKRIARLRKKRSELTARVMTSQDLAEARSINEQLDDVNAEIEEAQEELDAISADDSDGDTTPNLSDDGEKRQQNPLNVETRGGNPLAAYRMLACTGTSEHRENVPPYASMEYRQAFMAYVQRGTPIPADIVTRAGGDKGTTVTTDIGAIIPETIMNEFIKDVSKVYGQIYSKVRKLNVKGGVKFPISKLKANFKWITETTVSDKQKAGDIKDFITFEYNIGEIRVAETLLAQVVSLPLFESEITRIMVEAYVEMMDKVIISGTGSGQPLGITKDPRVTGNTSNIIEMTEAEFSDWTAWRKKLFAKVPLSKRGQGEFLFPASTVESYLLTMKDANDRPLFREATDLSMGNTAGSFFGRTTDLVEPDVIADFATAAAGDVVGIFWVPNDYAINTNLQFGMKRWFDDDTNEWINKGLTIVDGKILDVSGCYLIKKKAASKT